MIKTITKIGNSQGIIFDSAMMDMAHLKVGDKLQVTVHQGGSVVLTPQKPVITPEMAREAMKEIMKDYGEVFRRLA
jgi:antitoxin component of MazEF toxin-antitoxin module